MGEHTLRVAGSTTDLDGGWMRARLECDRCDLRVHIDRMAPIAAAERFIADLIEYHRAPPEA